MLHHRSRRDPAQCADAAPDCGRRGALGRRQGRRMGLIALPPIASGAPDGRSTETPNARGSTPAATRSPPALSGRAHWTSRNTATRRPGAPSRARRAQASMPASPTLWRTRVQPEETPRRRLDIFGLDHQSDQSRCRRLVSERNQRLDGHGSRAPESRRVGDDHAIDLRRLHGLTNELSRSCGDVLGVDAGCREQLLRLPGARHSSHRELHYPRSLLEVSER